MVTAYAFDKPKWDPANPEANTFHVTDELRFRHRLAIGPEAALP